VLVGHQVNFFVMPAELSDLEAAIRTTGDVCFLGEESPTAQPVELGALVPASVTVPPRFKYLILRRQELLGVSTRFVAAQGYWLIEATRSPVIEFSPCRFTGSTLTRGRAYFSSDLRFRPEPPDPDFVRWGDRVLTRIKKKLTRRQEFAPWLYFGASALQWVQDSGATMTGGATSFMIHER
jgi:hypothetical protein